jgi:hypothetical protein
MPPVLCFILEIHLLSNCLCTCTVERPYTAFTQGTKWLFSRQNGSSHYKAPRILQHDESPPFLGRSYPALHPALHMAPSLDVSLCDSLIVDCISVIQMISRSPTDTRVISQSTGRTQGMPTLNTPVDVCSPLSNSSCL